MKRVLVAGAAWWLFFATVATGIAGERGDAGVAADQSQIPALQEQIAADPEMFGLVMSLMNDPEMQAILQDQKLMEAVQSGNLAPLLANPHIQKLLENAQVQEVGKRLMNKGRKGTE